MPERITVAGRGNLGRSLARALRAAGHPARLVAARTGFSTPRDGILFLAVPDGAVADMAAKIARLEASRELSVVHVSGALGLGALVALRKRHAVGSFHPLQSFPAPGDPSAFRGITIAVDASTPALERRLRSLARAIGGRPKHVGDRERVLYHAAAVYASNFVDVVVAEAVRLLQEIGWSEREATAALMPLVEGGVANIGERGVVKALTGPIRRGDADTVIRHIEALRKLGSGPSGAAPPALPLRRFAPPPHKWGGTALYRMLALVALEIAREAGLDPAAAERTRRALTRHVAATRRRSGE
jgi:predicted short-subunit dehydrogenase-like oxidoreductase (DUF2520 family)